MPRVITSSTPVLESGDHLTREEFHRRYCARPDIKKAELIEGVVFVASPVRVDVHGEPHADVITWLRMYTLNAQGVRLADNATVILDEKNEPQPDAILWRDDPALPHLDAEGYMVRPPDLVVEIAASSASYDLHEKLRVYERSGVREYIVWRTMDRAIDWRRLESGRYVLVTPGADGVIESSVFPGLRLNVPKMVDGDMPGVLAELRPL